MSSVGDSFGNLPWRMNRTLPSVRTNFARVPVRRNVPLWTRISPSMRMSRGEPVIRRFEPDAPLVVSLGFDTYHTDPISNLALQTDDYARIGSAIAALGRPAVVLQEGGYAVEALGPNAVAFLSALAAR